MDVKHKKFGFTLIEILTVLGIIALLIGLLIPAMSMVRNTAREVKQNAQLTTIGLALTVFKNDYGDYPPSDGWDYTTPPGVPLDYCGAQKLAEALLGRDLLGFNKDSDWLLASSAIYYPTDPAQLDASLDNRREPYLELATTNTFRLGNISVDKPGLFNDTATLYPDTFVLCDVFGAKQITIIDKFTGKKVIFKAGAPILYFRANTSSKVLGPVAFSIYNVKDNDELIKLGRITDGREHPFYEPEHYSNFFTDIIDPRVTATPWPYRPDSYILISAGADGLYGTGDDITNFGN